jgi:SSS family solute:Na+ symporter
MFGLHIFDIIAIVIYFLIVIGIGVLSRRRIKSEEDFFMGGRRFGKLVSIFLAFGAGTSSDTAISASRETYRTGMSGIWIQLLWLFITPFYWIFAPWYRRLRVITGGDYFQERFNSKVLTGLYVGFSFLFLMFHIAVALTAIGKTVEIVTVKPESALTQEEKLKVDQYLEYNELKYSDNELSSDAQQRYLDLKVKAENREIQPYFSFLSTIQVVPIIAFIIVIYGVLGGLFAAAWTDTLQGILILILSLLLLPSGMHRVGWFSGLHASIPDNMFQIVQSATVSEYTWYYILVLIVMNLVGVVAQPHIFATGGGSAKNEITARIGLVFGNFLKRFTTIMWGLTGIMAFALFGKIVTDPDMIWGYATRMLLGPGFVGVMIACLLAAVMSSADAFMICGSALFTRNFYQYLLPDKSEQHYVFVGRIVSVGLIAGAILLSLSFNNILSLIKYIWQLPVIFGPIFWLSLIWRRLSKIAALTAVTYSWIMIVLLPFILSEISWFTTHEHAEIIKYPNLLFLYMAGINMGNLSFAWLMTINFSMQVVAPFLILYTVSILSVPPKKGQIDIIFARFHTPVTDNVQEDEKQIQRYIENPSIYDGQKLFPKSDWEFTHPDKVTVYGFIGCLALALAILGFAFLIANIRVP